MKLPTLTRAQVAEVARDCLARIAATPKHSVHASRRGICGGVDDYWPGRTVLFRRKAGRVRLEVWRNSSTHVAGDDYCRVHPLPPDLEAAAGAMLDQL